MTQTATTIQFLTLATLEEEQYARLLKRAETDIRELLPRAQTVIDRVRTEGDSAVVDYARQFDAPGFEASMLRATPQDFIDARAQLDPAVIAAIEAAHINIERFHREQMPESMWFTEVQPGVMAGEKVTPITSVGLYVPRG